MFEKALFLAVFILDIFSVFLIDYGASIIKLKSIEIITKWKNEFLTINDLFKVDDFPFLLLGNKVDLNNFNLIKFGILDDF